MKGYIALHRQIIESWVAEDPMALALWVRILTEATHKERKRGYKGVMYDLKPGDLLFGYSAWTEKTGIPRQVLRQRIEMLESDGMITRSKHPKITIISITNWSKYQHDNTLTTGSEHPNNTLTTPKQQQYNNVNNGDNGNNGIKDKEKSITPTSQAKRKRFTPPTFQEVSDYFFDKCGDSSDAQKFIDFYESKGWYVGKNKMKDWKASVRNWLNRRKEYPNTQGNKQSADDFYEQLANARFE